MAIPTGMTITRLQGKFLLNKSLSDSTEDILSLQSVPYAIRKLSKLVNLQLDVALTPVAPVDTIKDSGSSPLQMTITSTLSSFGPLGLAPLKKVGFASSYTESRVLDGSEFTTEDPIVGTVDGKMWVCTAADLTYEALDEFLTDGWIACGQSSDQVELVRVSLRSRMVKDEANAWTAEHVWGIEDTGAGTKEGEALTYTRRMVVSRGEKTARARIVYDFVK